GTGYSFAVTAGALPGGLTLAANGVLSGTVARTTVGGSYSFTVTVTDSLGGTGTRAYALSVHIEATLTGPADRFQGVAGEVRAFSAHILNGPADPRSA